MRIKFVSKTPVERMAPLWEALVPEGGIDGADFTFDPDDRDYDFLCVYEDLPPLPGERKITRSEPLACPREHTLLIVPEPASIRINGLRYLRQFGVVWTTARYPDLNSAYVPGHHVYEMSAPPLRWFYGRDMEGDDHWPLARIEASPEKTADLSTVCSTKAMGHTVHAKRLEFTRALKERLGDGLALFGRGFDAVGNKAEAMAPYRYHLAIENHVQSGHLTEKLTDCFLAECLPFYFGDPDYARHFPDEAVIPIDIFDLDGAEATIRSAIADDLYTKRRQAILEAKAITLREFNTLRAVARVARNLVQEPAEVQPSATILGRHAFRRAHPVLAARDAVQSARLRRSAMADPLQGYKPLR